MTASRSLAQPHRARWILGLLPLVAGCTGFPLPEGSPDSRLVSSSWLNEHLGEAGLVIIDARTTGEYVEKHIPGAVSASFSAEQADSHGYRVTYGGGIDFFVDADNAIPFQDGPPAQIQEAVRNFGINQGDTVIVYDVGGHFHAARFLWTLTLHGFENIYILDGGLQKWAADGYATTADIPPVTPGNFLAAEPDATQVATTDDVLAAVNDPDTVLITGLDATWYYGSYLAYTIPGHIPGTKLLPLANFFNADHTWKSAAEIQTLLGVVGITPDQTIISYCGGGPLSSGMYFALKHVLGRERVLNYTGSYLAWINDPRGLPVNTYDHEGWLRDTAWMHWWAGERMQRLMPVSPALAVDVRSPEDYQAGHIPWSVNIPMTDPTEVTARSATEWSDLLGAEAVGSTLEVVAVDETVTPAATLFFWLMQYLGHDAVSVASEGLVGWQAGGYTLATEDTLIEEPLTPIDVALEPTTFTAGVRSDLRLSSPDEVTNHPFARVWVVCAEEVPADLPVASYVHVPWTANLTADGQLLPAGDLWTLYSEAEVPFFSEIVCYSDRVDQATMAYFVLRLLGFPRVLVYLPADAGL